MNKNEMNMDELMNILQEEAVIPEVVQKKAADAFAAIKREAEDAGYASVSERKYHRSRKKKFVLVALAAVLAFGTISMAAVYLRQSKSLTEGLRSTEQQKEQL